MQSMIRRVKETERKEKEVRHSLRNNRAMITSFSIRRNSTIQLEISSIQGVRVLF